MPQQHLRPPSTASTSAAPPSTAASERAERTSRERGGERPGRPTAPSDAAAVHLFEPATRAHYDLEMLWGDAPRIEIPGRG